MPNSLKRNAVAMFGFAALIVLTQYKVARLSVTPLRQDPGDAVWHFAFFVMLFTLAVSTLRTFRPYRREPASTAQYVYVIRSQQAFVLALFMGLAADIIALARHPSMWINADWRNHLLAWLSVLAAVAVAMESLVHASQTTRPHSESPRSRLATLASVLALTALAFSPEYGMGIKSTTAHILTVVLGALVLFVPMHYLLPVLVPYESGEEPRKEFFTTTGERYALVIGVLIGSFAFWVDAHKTGVARPLFPMLKFVGPPMGLFIAYAFLAKPLGLTLRRRVSR